VTQGYALWTKHKEEGGSGLTSPITKHHAWLIITTSIKRTEIVTSLNSGKTSPVSIKIFLFCCFMAFNWLNIDVKLSGVNNIIRK
jgi:hypothetical protein